MAEKVLAQAGAPEVASLSFEAALKQLEEIVVKLERGDVPLEESIAIYERGEALKKRCEALLGQAEERVERIRAADGKAIGTEPFDAAWSATWDVPEVANDKLVLLIVTHMTFVVSALLLAFMDRIQTSRLPGP